MSVELIMMVQETGAGFEQFTSAFLKSMAAEQFLSENFADKFEYRNIIGLCVKWRMPLQIIMKCLEVTTYSVLDIYQNYNLGDLVYLRSTAQGQLQVSLVR